MVKERLGIAAVTGLFEENPGAEMFHKAVIIVPTSKTAAGMSGALHRLARLALKLGRGEQLGPPEVDGYLPRGYRQNEFSNERGATRAVKMLLSKIKGESYLTEWPVPRTDTVEPAGPLEQGQSVRVALVTTSGLVPKGNPDRVPGSWATTWRKYDLTEVEDLSNKSFETIHGGFDTTAANEDPDRIVPVDALRALEKEGRLQLYPHLYSTVGNSGSITEMRRIGTEIALDLYSAGIDAVIVGATWGTCTRSGATIAKELERAGLPTVLVTAITPLAQSIGVNRIVRGQAVPNPWGDPALEPGEEREFRKRMVEKALEALCVRVEQPTVFEVKE